MIKDFKGIDWKNYIKIMNKAVKDGSNAHEPYKDLDVLDIEVITEDSKSDDVSDTINEAEGKSV